MINFSTGKESIALAQTYNNKGLGVRAQSGSPLSILHSKLLGGLGTSLNTEPLTPEYISSLSESFSKTGGGDATTFAIVLDRTAQQIAGHVRSHLSYAKNVVTPVIADLVKGLTDYSNALKENDGSDFKINVYKVPAPLKAASLREHLTSYVDALPNYNVTLPGEVRQEQELLDSLTQAIPGLEDELKDWVSTLTPGYVSNIWQERFTSKRGSSIYVQDLDYHLVVYLLSGRVGDSPSEGSPISLAEWKRAADRMHVEAGKMLAGMMARIDDQISLGILITGWESGSVTVNEVVYKDWLDKGGSVSTIMAATLQARVPTTVLEIEDRLQKLTSDWSRHQALVSSTFAARKHTLMKDALSMKLPAIVKDHAKQIYSAFGEDTSHFENLPVHQEFHKRLSAFCKELRSVDFDDLWKLSRSAVCSTVFYFTDSEALLKYREAAFKVNPDISSDDAEFLARIEYVSDYVFDQIDVFDLK